MRNVADGRGAIQSADRAYREVDVQHQVVSVMRLDDPALSYAIALLRRMEQSAAMTALSQIFDRQQAETSALPHTVGDANARSDGL